jgi:hypothetical protein
MAAVLAIFQAIPILNDWLKQLVALYIQQSIKELHSNDLEAIRKAINDHDQRDLEKQIGNSHPGEPSHLAGTELRDSLPGVPGPDKGGN